MTLSTVFGGFGDIWNLILYMFPPIFDNFPEALRATIETIWMALIGTTMAVVLSVPLAFMAARNTSPHPVVMAISRGIISLARAIPALVLAAIFASSVGIGPLPGVLALGLHSIGMIGKLFAEAIENTEATSRDAVVSTGAGKWQTVLATIVPQIMPSSIGTSLYRLDINLRESAVLGFVGAGGIGFLIWSELRGLDYQRAISAVSVTDVVMRLVFIASQSTLLRLRQGADLVNAKLTVCEISDCTQNATTLVMHSPNVNRRSKLVGATGLEPGTPTMSR